MVSMLFLITSTKKNLYGLKLQMIVLQKIFIVFFQSGVLAMAPNEIILYM